MTYLHEIQMLSFISAQSRKSLKRKYQLAKMPILEPIPDVLDSVPHTYPYASHIEVAKIWKAFSCRLMNTVFALAVLVLPRSAFVFRVTSEYLKVFTSREMKQKRL